MRRYQSALDKREEERNEERESTSLDLQPSLQRDAKEKKPKIRRGEIHKEAHTAHARI